jgi:hypothetical protein
MLKWIGRLWRRKQAVAPQRSEADATRYLNDLRENELSLGAALRRGDKVTTAPGQTKAAMAKATAPVMARPTSQPTAGYHATETQASKPGEDFAASMTIGMATGSAGAGYLAGGSITGGMIGDAISDLTDDSTSSRPPGD